MLDENEFLSPHGIRSLSKFHAERPSILTLDGQQHHVDYEPAESTIALFGGNSNWRGPVWFPLNFLLIEACSAITIIMEISLRSNARSAPAQQDTLWEVAAEFPAG